MALSKLTSVAKSVARKLIQILVSSKSSVQDLEGSNGLIQGQQVSLKGWHPDSDVGGGVLYWDSTKLKSEHNGGTVFSPTVPFSATTSDYLDAIGETDGAGSGCWVRIVVGNVLVTDFGALGNGVIDDTKSIQAALDNRVSVRIPAGTYRVTTTVFVHALMNITGDGLGSIIQSEVVGEPIFKNSETMHGCHISKFRVAGSGSESSGLFIDATFEGVRYEDLHFSGVGGKCFYFKDNWVVTAIGLRCEGNFISKYGMFLEGCTNSNFYGCLFKETLKEGAGVGVIRSSGGNYVLNFNGCLFEANLGPGFAGNSLNATTFDTCYFEQNALEFQNDNSWRSSHIEFKEIEGNPTTTSTTVTVRGSYFHYINVEHIIKSSEVITNLTLENLNTESFGTHGHQLTRYDIDLSLASLSRLNLIGENPENVDDHGYPQRVSATGYTGTDVRSVGLYYLNSAATAVEGVIPTTGTVTRSLKLGATNMCAYSIKSIDVSALLSGGLGGRAVVIVPPTPKKSSGVFSGCIEHVGTSATGALSFYAATGSTTEYFFVRKQRLTSGGSFTGKVEDIDGVTTLQGSFSYF